MKEVIVMQALARRSDLTPEDKWTRLQAYVELRRAAREAAFSAEQVYRDLTGYRSPTKHPAQERG